MASNDGGDTSSPPPPPPPAEGQTAESAPPSVVTVAGNIDLLISILTRIEAKPLIRFKSVSKQWLSLISSPRFSRLHTLQNPNPKPSALFFHPIRQNDEIDYEFVPLTDPSSPPFRSLRVGDDPSSIDVLSSCNGLLLCSTRCESDEMDDQIQKHYVLNPTTKQFSALTPPAGGGSLSASSTRFSLAFDPLKSPHYKVVMVRSAPGTTAIGGNVTMSIYSSETRSWDLTQPKQMFEIHIYSSETRSWKKHDREIEWPNFFMFKKGVYSNGAMHWASKKDGFMCFDIDRERTRRMPKTPPFRGWDESVLRYFGGSGGDLHLVDIQGYELMEMDVYVLERDYSKWSRKYRVDMNRFSGSYPGMVLSDDDLLTIEYYNFSLLGVVQVGYDPKLVLHIPGKVISYGLKSKGITVLRHLLLGEVYQMRVCYARSFDGHLYSETLAGA